MHGASKGTTHTNDPEEEERHVLLLKELAVIPRKGVHAARRGAAFGDATQMLAIRTIAWAAHWQYVPLLGRPISRRLWRRIDDGLA